MVDPPTVDMWTCRADGRSNESAVGGHDPQPAEDFLAPDYEDKLWRRTNRIEPSQIVGIPVKRIDWRQPVETILLGDEGDS